MRGPRHLFTAAEAARLLHIPPGTIRSWKARGLLFEFGLTERGNPMYDRDHLVALRDRRRAS
jgi:DNA-binding transcriptional MerR regulator